MNQYLDVRLGSVGPPQDPALDGLDLPLVMPDRPRDDVMQPLPVEPRTAGPWAQAVGYWQDC